MKYRWTAPLALTLLIAGLALLPGCGVADLVDEALTEEKDVPMGAQMTGGERGDAIAVFQQVNQIRAAHGLQPVIWDEEAADLAYDHAVDMRRRGFYAHTNPDGLSPRDRAVQRGLVMDWFGGENIARNNDSPGDAMNAWMNSPGHRAAILMPDFTHLGVGVHAGKGGPWWVQEFFVRSE